MSQHKPVHSRDDNKVRPMNAMLAASIIADWYKGDKQPSDAQMRALFKMLNERLK